MKKLLLIATLCIGLTACDPGQTPSDQPTPDQPVIVDEGGNDCADGRALTHEGVCP